MGADRMILRCWSTSSGDHVLLAQHEIWVRRRGERAITASHGTFCREMCSWQKDPFTVCRGMENSKSTEGWGFLSSQCIFQILFLSSRLSQNFPYKWETWALGSLIWFFFKVLGTFTIPVLQWDLHVLARLDNGCECNVQGHTMN